MRALIGVILVAAALWAGYWIVGSRALEQAANDWFQAQAAQGFVAERESLTVAGFPSRFDLTVTDVHLADPALGLGWRAPFAQVFSLSYKPWHLIAALPNDQVVSLQDQDVSVTSTKMMGSLILVPGGALTLDRLATEADDLRLQSDLGWQAAAGKFRFATRKDAGSAFGHEIGIEVRDLAPDAGLMAVLAATGLPAHIELVRLSAVLELSAALDRHTRETRPEILAVDAKEGLIRWGDLVVFAKGRLVADAEGRAEGRLELRVENWRDALVVIEAVGMIAPGLQMAFQSVLTNLVAQSADPNVLDLPLTMQGGLMSLGPIPLGPAPRLR